MKTSGMWVIKVLEAQPPNKVRARRHRRRRAVAVLAGTVMLLALVASLAMAAWK